MKQNLEQLTIKFCESLPIPLTILEKENKCTKPNRICKYCQKIEDNYFCNKKAYIFSQSYERKLVQYLTK